MKAIISKLHRLTIMLAFCNTFDTKAQSLCSANASPIYTDAQITVTTSIVYGSAIPAGGSAPVDYKYDMYSPPSAGIRYAIVLFSGGGFGNVDRTQMDKYCMEFAKRGIVAFTCDYRTGNSGCGPQNDCACDNKMLATYRAVQDGRAAMRHIAHNASTYEIDKDHLFIGGESAGAILSMYVTYYNQAEIDSVIKGGFATLGGIDNSTNTLTDTYTISAVMNLWGQVHSAINSVSMIGAGDAAMICFHGKEDSTCPYGKGSYKYCSYPGKIYWYGSKPITERLKALGICHELYTDSDGQHGLGKEVTDYGLGEIPPTPVPAKKTYITERATCFFKSVMCNYCNDVSQKNFKDVLNATCSDPTLRINQDEPSSPGVSLWIESKMLSVQAPGQKILEITIYNLMGERVSCDIIHDYSAMLDLGNLANGIYLVEVSDENKRELRKIFIH